MPEFLSKLLEQIRGIWGNLTAARKAILVLVGIGILAGLVAIIFLYNKSVEYKTLYSDLASADLAEIETELDRRGIPYQISEDGRSILIPVEQVHQARMWLANKGLPRSDSIGFGLFDESRFGMTDFAQHVQYRRALEGELANTITQIEQINQAWVHIVIPRPSVFIEEESPAKASVLLKIVPGEQLNKRQIDGIIHLVASAVEGLQPDNVELVDNSNGVLLNREVPSLSESIKDQLKYQQAIESAYKDRIVSMLSPVLGASKLTSRVSVEMDFDSFEVTKEEYDPYTVIESEQKIKESTERLAEITGGVPGMASNVNVNTDPNLEPSGIPQATNNLLEDRIPIRQTKEDNTTTYLVGKSVLRSQKSAGSIKRITASVIVDNKYDPVNNQLQKWKQSDLKDLENIVKSAIGFNASRGDVVEVKNIPFATTQLPKTKEKVISEIEQREKLYENLAKLGFALIVVVFIYFMLLRPLFRGISRLIAIPEEDIGEIPVPEEEVEPVETAEELLQRISPAIASEEATDLQALRKLAEESPEKIEGLIMHWLTEDDIQ